MSLYGSASAYFSNNLDGGSFIGNYFSTVLNNFVFALPLQLIIIGPLVRYVFQSFVKGKMADALS
ncbi:hypothetical protein [Paenibacillus harenae]|uniref:hypothetical protein n=1 Tax=Paenibacillus harenae TaxID=306543 RepID=UPI0027D7F009|nr:hypothetical protein [Paenibacillus harenae]